MKQTARKLLSLLMAFAIVLTLAPAALADEDSDSSYTLAVTGTATTNVGQSVTLTATLKDGDTPVTSGVTYKWSFPNTMTATNGDTSASVTLEASGTPTTDVTGSVTCTATYNSAEYSSSATEVKFTYVAPQNPVATGIKIEPSSVTLTLGSNKTSQVLTATVEGDAGVSQEVSWSIKSGSEYITLDGGTVTAKAAGTAVVTATAEAKNASGGTVTQDVSITVNPAATVTPEISISSTTKTVAMGSTLPITATVVPADAKITWTVSSSDGGGGAVEKSGSTYVFTPISAGTVKIKGTITPSAGTTVDSNELNITVTAPTSSITLTAASTSLRPGASTNLTIVPSDGVTVTSATWKLSYPNSTLTAGATLGQATTSGSAAATNTVTIGTSTAAGTRVRVTAEAVLSDGSTKSNYCDITVANPVYISTSASGASASTYTLNGYGSNVSLYAQIANATAGASYSYSWSVTGNSNVLDTGLYNTYNSSRLDVQAIGTGTARVTVTVTSGGTTIGTAYIDITVQNTGLQPSVTVYRDSEYVFSEKDKNGTSSVADQIASLVRNNTGRYLYSVVFSTTTSTYGDLSASRNYTYYADGITSSNGGRLSDIVFTPKQVGTATFSFTAYYATNNGSPGINDYVTGVLNVKVEEGTSSGDITYTADLGKDVYFDVSDFEDFWNKIYTRGTLSYVTFGSVSGGTVYNSNGKSAGSGSYYADPTRSSQSDLDGVYFSPNSTTSKKATTIRIPFSAYGSTTANGSVSSSPRTGTIVITYLSAAADKITYSTNASGIAALKAQDFIDAYKAAANTKTTPSNLTIVFQGVPSYGTLTYNDSSKSNSRDVKLTSSNIKNYKFTTKTSGTNQIGDVTYSVSGSRTDTISYIGYIGTTATFTGEVTFNAVTAPTDVRVNYTCYTAAGIPLTSSYFTAANSAMANASYVILGSPRSGRLSNTSGATVVNTAVLISQLGSVTYVPTGAVAGVATTDSFTFTAYNSSNVVVASGTVNVTVSLPAASTGTITDISQLTDVPATAYYRTYLSDLIRRGVIKGTGGSKFSPDEELDYSQALKFIMNAAGYYETELSGASWALNYKNRAVQNGWLDNSVDITQPIPRGKMAELAAKVLGIPASTQASPFSDTTNAYAVALYYTTPQILQGQTSGAKPVFNENATLRRHEMISLVYRMYQYSGK